MDKIAPHMLAFGPDISSTSGPTQPAGPRVRMPPVRRLLRLAMRWRWVLLGGAAVGAFAGLALTLLMTRQYSASVRLEIAREAPHVTNIESVERDAGFANQEFYQTQYGLLQTKVLAERVARDLKLVDDPDFFGMFGRKDVLAAGTGPTDPATRAHRVEVAGRILLDHVGVAPVRGSSLVDVTAVTPDPALSQHIAQTWAKDFIASNLERRFDASSYARHFLEDRLAQLRDRLERSERQAVAYAEAQGIIDLPGGSDNQDDSDGGSGTRSLVTENLALLNRALATATAQRIEAESLLSQAHHADASSEALDNQAIGAMREKRAEAASDYAKLMSQFEPDYPQVKAAAAQVRALDGAIAREEGRVRTSLEQSYYSAVQREQDLLAKVDTLKAGFTDLQRRSIQYNIYRRDADTNRQLYNALLQRYKEIGVAGGVEDNNIQIADPAKLPDRPSSPRLMVNLILATLAGGLLAIALAAVLEQIDEGINDPAEVEEKLGLPLIGTIPRIADDPLAALGKPHSSLVEAYLAVQANLQLSTAHGMPRSLAVTSTRPREGKSTTALALAQLLARAHRRVALIDADMRSPSIHEAFGIANDRGVSNFLSGSDDALGALQQTAHDGLSVLPAGPQPPNAAELLTGARLELLIERLFERFDHVIVDSPPVIGLADAPLVAAAVESVVYAVEARSIQAGTVRIALDRLRTAHANVIGAVLTKFDARRSTLGYGYDYGYGYGYRDEER
ncbi:MAG TPA: polysaccharide biosynthesis tyrosine autokinase [Sphingomonas sp.]|nr:polysaccharide biosynthesis tyrosine autokinase [Sphingomonas sp.]